MAATLTIEWQELLWYLEGAARGSHLRWGVYEDFVNRIFPQLNEQDRANIYHIARRNLLGDMREYHDAGLDQFEKMLARFNPANQYRVKMKRGREKAQTVQAYLWQGDYYVDWMRRCAPEYIKDIQQLPFPKCINDRCASKDICLRHSYKDGDEIFPKSTWTCDKCDFIIEIQKEEEL